MDQDRLMILIDEKLASSMFHTFYFPFLVCYDMTRIQKFESLHISYIFSFCLGNRYSQNLVGEKLLRIRNIALDIFFNFLSHLFVPQLDGDRDFRIGVGDMFQWRCIVDIFRIFSIR